MDTKHTNRLIKESSPYLQQHAHNPVDWYPWGKEALERAIAEDKPVLVSIGYSACHWCHVMEHESFEDESVAAYMNAHFINIKIDREERPDLDHIYMDAVQAIAGNGGWPLNVFVTPSAKPFYGGTYFPPQKAFNRPSWMEILHFISDTWQNKKEEVLEQADILAEHINASGNKLLKDLTLKKAPESNGFQIEECKIITENILKQADISDGGFGTAPKFPQTFIIRYLLMAGHFFDDAAARDHALFSIQQLLNGGIYDQLAGGMSRYSTDKQWLAPHFEKMLYDNALLVSVLADAYQITRDDFYRNGIDDTLGFIIREMKHEEGGFYAAFDADSEGVEGKFYVWDKVEIISLIGAEGEMCCEWYGVNEKGNWEGKNILHVHTSAASFAAKNRIGITELLQKINGWNKILLEERNKRIPPSIDDKILLGWNALLLTAFCKSYMATGNKQYLFEAEELLAYIQVNFQNKEGGYFHTFKEGEARHPAFLDDYACLIQSLISLQEITGKQELLVEAEKLTDYVISWFQDAETGMFAFTNEEQEDVIVRKKEIYDGAVPSGNSLMAENLFQLSVLLYRKEWGELAAKMVLTLREVLIKYPSSFGIWCSIYLQQAMGIHEIVVTGNNIEAIRKEVLELYIPNKVFQSSEKPYDFPLLNNRNFGGAPLIYVCRQYACSLPVSTSEDMKKQLK